MKKAILSAMALCALTLGAAPVIEKLEFPATVRPGETFRLTVTASAPEGEAITYSFNGASRTAPPDFRFYEAKDFAAKYSKVEKDGTVTAGSNYHTLLSIPFPNDGKRYTVWVCSAGGALCLRRPDKELKWSFSKSDAFRWISFGQYDHAQAGDVINLMAEKAPYARVGRIILTTADAGNYKPGENTSTPNVFEWTPDSSSAGEQNFTVTVSAGGESVVKKISVNVLSAGQEKTPPFTSSGVKRPLTLGNAVVKPADYPVFDFFGNEYRKKLESAPFGLKFQPDVMVALRCNAYPALPASVTFPVNAKSAGIAFLLTEYWQGEVGQEMAHFLVRYADGTEERVPLREEFELCGSLRNFQPQNALYAGTFTSGQAEFHLTLFPWVNPRPEKEIASITFSNVRMVISQEENKLIPLNVTAESSQILLGAYLFDGGADITKLASLARKTETAISGPAAVTVNFQEKGGTIHPYVFSTNESGVLSSGNAGFDDYLGKMKTVGCKLYRFHSGWNLEKVYPEGLKNPQFDNLVLTIEKLKKADPAWDVMICFNRIPEYVNPKTPEGRKLFADLCADLVRELNIERKLKLRYWEIYNEVYFKKIEEDRSLWKMYSEAAAAMRKVDPSIKIGGYAPCWPSISAIRDFYSHCHAQTDFISYHKYLTGSVKTPTEYIMDGAATFGQDARAIRAMAQEITPGKPVELALTEYNINFNWKPHDPRQANQIGAAWFASVLHHLILADVEIAQTWHSRGGGTFGLFSKDNEPRPATAVFALGNRFLTGEYLKSGSTSKQIECLGFRNESHAGAMLINKSGQPVTVKLNLLNLPETALESVLPSVEQFRVRNEKTEACSQMQIPEELELSPYEVLLLRFPLAF